MVEAKTVALHYSISPAVFEHFPEYTRGVVLGHGVKNGASPPELVALLRQEENALRKRIPIDAIGDHPLIKPWREAYRSFGARPREFRSSVEALSRRVLHEQELPSISTLVDIGTIVSLRHLVPVGGHAIDVVTQDLELCVADGNESFVAFGSETVESPPRGEIIFTEGNTVLTRRWNWRQANHTLLTLNTKDVEFNIDGLLPVTPEQIARICIELSALLEKYCAGRFSHELLRKDHPSTNLPG